MVSFNSILVATAAFASIVSAIPTPEVRNSLNIAHRAPRGIRDVGDSILGTPLRGPGIDGNRGLLGTGIGSKNGLLGTGLLGDSLLGTDNLIQGDKSKNTDKNVSPMVKRGGSSCMEVIQKCHDGIAVIVIKIS